MLGCCLWISCSVHDISRPNSHGSGGVPKTWPPFAAKDTSIRLVRPPKTGALILGNLTWACPQWPQKCNHRRGDVALNLIGQEKKIAKRHHGLADNDRCTHMSFLHYRASRSMHLADTTIPRTASFPNVQVLLFLLSACHWVFKAPTVPT